MSESLLRRNYQHGHVRGHFRPQHRNPRCGGNACVQKGWRYFNSGACEKVRIRCDASEVYAQVTGSRMKARLESET